MTLTVTPADREHWLALRSRFLGASEVAGLIGVHPYVTAYSLWAGKTGRLPADGENAPMKRGRYLEDVALRVLADDYPDWTVAPNPIPGGLFFIDALHRMACTPDAFATAPDRDGPGIIQVKSVEPGKFRREWIDAEGKVEAPLHVAVQAIVERHLTGARWGLVAALVVDAGITLHLVEVPDVPGLVERLQSDVATFWRLVDSDRRPDPDYGRDLGTIRALAPRQDDGEIIDLTGDNLFSAALNDHAQCTREMTWLSARKERAEAEIRDKLGPASAARAGELFVTARTVRRKGYSVPASVYRPLRISTHAEDNE
jgi:hypothetical protein